MLYHLLFPLHTRLQPFNVFQYITFRALCAGLTSLIFSLALGPYFIRMLSSHQLGQQVRDDGPKSHLKKSGTPTMGGILILLSVGISTLLWADLTNAYIWIVIGVMVAFGFIGWLDDFKKIKEANSKGLSERAKLILQTLFAAAAIGLIFYGTNLDTELHIPFIRTFQLDLGLFYLFFAWLVMVGTSNSVNLTDGLDGLAIMPIVMVAAGLGVFAYLAGDIRFANYLHIPYVKYTSELVVICSAMVGAGLAFLWYNAHPAQIFMGDVGALALGAMLGTIAVMVRQEIVFAIMGGVFVMEAVSVFLQIGSLRMRNKRVFLMAPLHHHYEEKGWKETQVVTRFWIITIMLVVLGLMTLKLR